MQKSQRAVEIRTDEKCRCIHRHTKLKRVLFAFAVFIQYKFSLRSDHEPAFQCL